MDEKTKNTLEEMEALAYDLVVFIKGRKEEKELTDYDFSRLSELTGEIRQGYLDLAYPRM